MNDISWHLSLMAVVYILAGCLHFIKPQFYKGIIPSWLPAHKWLIILSGFAEILLGILLFFPETREMALYGIVLMLLSFLPVHWYMLRDKRFLKLAPRWVWVLRFLLQFLLIYWALVYVK
ncbi:DoxX family protein [Robertkochia aurantiaca]|uniref:DoxX family protein n=1 Tax=Robertkochia aurantiaca TaxID=2873700 RepID=UPI001CCF454B|nr:MauE/DoxX family redox-associated membrane protein [Robertkochia sp. 3YJGBD-33]